MKNLRACESARGKFRVSINPTRPTREMIKIEARGLNGEFINQMVDIESTEDLIDLFVVIASVLNMNYDTDTFK